MLNKHHAAFSRRDDLSDAIDGVLADAAGPGSWDISNRQHLSGAIWDHFGEFDAPDPGRVEKPGAITRLVEHAVRAGALAVKGLTLDAGCGVGRSTFELAARTGEPVLGVDMHVASLRFAQGLLRSSRVSYLRRSLGLLYERREFDVPIPAASLVDFWMMDVLRPCVGAGAGKPLATITAFNLLDCVESPLGFLQQAASMLGSGGSLTVATPFDWSTTVTPIEAWIGGHSPRGYEGGKSDELLVQLLTPGGHVASLSEFRVLADLRELPWHVRVHARSVMHYTLQMVVARRG